MNKLLTIAMMLTMVLVALSLARPALADTPQVRSVVAWNDGGDTKLNVTIYHNGEVPGHYIDIINVTVISGTSNVSQTFPQSGPHTLDLSTLTFNVTLNFGPLSTTTLATVEAHCNIHGWTANPQWTGSIPEYGLPLLLLTLAGATSALLMMKKGLEEKSHRKSARFSLYRATSGSDDRSIFVLSVALSFLW